MGIGRTGKLGAGSRNLVWTWREILIKNALFGCVTKSAKVYSNTGGITIKARISENDFTFLGRNQDDFRGGK